MPGKEKTVKTLFLEYFLYNYCCHEQFDVTLLEKFEAMTSYDEAGENITFMYTHLHVPSVELLKSLCDFIDEDELDIVDHFAHSRFAIGGATIWFKSINDGVDLKTILLNSKRF